MPTTANSKLPYPAQSDPADVPLDISRLATALDELAYNQATATVSVTATTEAGGQLVVQAPAVTFDGATAVIVEFFAPFAQTPNVAGFLEFDLFQDGASLGLFGRITTSTNANLIVVPVNLRRRITPASGSHTYSVRGYVGSGSGTVIAGPGSGPGTVQPAFIRITRA